jgi:spore maturation protein CgeB
MKDSKIILLVMDSIFRVKRAYENIKLYDYRFMFEKTDVEKLKKEGIGSFFFTLGIR